MSIKSWCGRFARFSVSYTIGAHSIVDGATSFCGVVFYGMPNNKHSFPSCINATPSQVSIPKISSIAGFCRHVAKNCASGLVTIGARIKPWQYPPKSTLLAHAQRCVYLFNAVIKYGTHQLRLYQSTFSSLINVPVIKGLASIYTNSVGIQVYRYNKAWRMGPHAVCRGLKVYY